MPVDFKLAPEVEEVRLRVRSFMDDEVRPMEERLRTSVSSPSEP